MMRAVGGSVMVNGAATVGSSCSTPVSISFAVSVILPETTRGVRLTA